MNFDMYKIELGKSGLFVPTVAVGCMRISNMNEKEASAFVETALTVNLKLLHW